MQNINNIEFLNLRAEIRLLQKYLTGKDVELDSDYPYYYKDRDEAVIVFNDDGTAKITSWMESLHNGSSYDTKVNKLSKLVSLQCIKEMREGFYNNAVQKYKLCEIDRKLKLEEDCKTKEAEQFVNTSILRLHSV